MKGLRLSVQLVLVAAISVALVGLTTASVWIAQVRQLIAEETRDEAVALAVALGSSHYADVAQRNHAQIQLDFLAVAERTPDVAYLLATDAAQGDAIIAAVPHDVVGMVVPDVVPAPVSRASTKGESPRVALTFLVREGIPGAHAGDAVMDVTEDVRLRDGTRVGRVRVGVLLRRQDEAFRRAVELAIGIALAVLLFGVAAAAMLARRVAAPVAALRDRMVKVAEGDLSPHVITGGPVEVQALSAAYNEMIVGLKKKRALERYVPIGARRALDARGGEGGIVAPRRERAVVLFADLRGFSTMSEKRSPADVLEVLNGYTDAMTEVVTAHGGDVNELLGDAVLAVFTTETAAADAVRCAAEMQERLREVEGGELRMGIGLHLGDVVLGTVGAGDRMKYAVVGDTVNVAARIQERARQAEATAVIASEDVVREAGDRRWRDLGEMNVRGRQATLRIYELEKP